MIIFCNLQKDKTLSNQHLLDANHIKKNHIWCITFEDSDLVQKTTTTKNCIKYLSYYIPTGLKVIFFCFVIILFIQQKMIKTKFKVIES